MLVDGYSLHSALNFVRITMEGNVEAPAAGAAAAETLRVFIEAVALDIGLAIDAGCAANFISEEWLQENGSPYETDLIPDKWVSKNYRFFCRQCLYNHMSE